ncbi:hypothetical protein ACFVXE_15245 [Streptomyces sp. NPDC058231]|uniref:hypothetical protein n=1 Tax=Streptomyces sp. NPDC058231 TaxID=3346392 RepID=UPI0036F0F7CE
MLRRKLKTVVLICAATSLAATVVPASASTRAKSAADVTVVDCFSQPQVRPGTFLIACGDGNSILVKMRWSEWKQNVASGSGLNVVNDCLPYCAAGKFHSYPVTVRLDRPKAWQKDPAQKHYTELRVVYTGARPSHMPREMTYRLWN